MQELRELKEQLQMSIKILTTGTWINESCCHLAVAMTSLGLRKDDENLQAALQTFSLHLMPRRDPFVVNKHITESFRLDLRHKSGVNTIFPSQF